MIPKVVFRYSFHDNGKLLFIPGLLCTINISQNIISWDANMYQAKVKMKQTTKKKTTKDRFYGQI